MYFEDYKREVFDDACDAMMDYLGYYDRFEEVFDELFIDDCVTGNGSGSYTFSTAVAAQNVAELIWDTDFIEECRDMGYNGVPTDDGPEALDVIARCCALYCVCPQLEERWDELTEDEEEEDE